MIVIERDEEVQIGHERLTLLRGGGGGGGGGGVGGGGAARNGRWLSRWTGGRCVRGRRG